jgi:hypothetical protein
VQSDWNDNAVASIDRDEAGANGQIKYGAGKVFAERLVLQYPSLHEGLGWDVVNLLPSWVSDS